MIWLILTIILVLILLIFTGLAWAFIWKTFKPSKLEELTPLWHYEAYKSRCKRTPVDFYSRGNKLVAHIYEAADREDGSEDSGYKTTKKTGTYSDSTSPIDGTETEKTVPRKKGVIIFAHGLISGPDEYMMLIVPLVERGYTVFSYSITSYNGSQGSWTKGLPMAMLNLNDAISFVENDERFKGQDIYLLGHSWGGYSVTAVLRYRHRIKASVALSGFNEPMEITRNVGKNFIGPIAGPVSLFVRFFEWCMFGKDYNHTAVEGINTKRVLDPEKNDEEDYVPVLLFHGVNDNFIEYDKSSINCKEKEIINPKARYIKLQEPERSRHDDYFGTKEGSVYWKDLNSRLYRLNKHYKGEELAAKKKDFLKTVDFKLANEPNVYLIDQIDRFFTGNH